MIALPQTLHFALRANGMTSRLMAERDQRFDPLPVIKLFNPVGAATWIATELDEDDDTLFGLADLGFGCPELGSFSLREIASVRLPFGLFIEPMGDAPLGIFIQSDGAYGTGFLVESSGIVEYGDINISDGAFNKIGYVDRDLPLNGDIRFRLLRKGRLTEFYIEDYLMQCYCLPDLGSGRIGLIEADRRCRELQAWYCS